MAGNHTFRGSGERWPHSTGIGAKADQKNAGPRVWDVDVRANNMSEAVEKIELYRKGIETNPYVWMAPLQKVEQID